MSGKNVGLGVPRGDYDEEEYECNENGDCKNCEYYCHICGECTFGE